MDRCLKAALLYRSWGWSAIAACNPKHLYIGTEHARICKSPGKVPANLQWKYWQTHLPDPEEIENQFKYFPDSNVCVVTGEVSGLIGIDIDGNLEEIRKELDWLELPKTISFKTSRGLRFLYKYPPNSIVRSTNYKAKSGGIDVLSNGKQTVMPPSRHCSGCVYEWIKGFSNLASFPTWEISQRQEKCLTVKDIISEGERNTRLFKAACGARRHGADEKDLLSLVSSMNNRCVPPLSDNDLRVISNSASKYSPTW